MEKRSFVGDFSATNQILTITEKNVKVVREFVCADFCFLFFSFYHLIHSFTFFWLCARLFNCVYLQEEKKTEKKKSESLNQNMRKCRSKQTLCDLLFLSIVWWRLPSKCLYSIYARSVTLFALSRMAIISATWFFLLFIFVRLMGFILIISAVFESKELKEEKKWKVTCWELCKWISSLHSRSIVHILQNQIP